MLRRFVDALQKVQNLSDLQLIAPLDQTRTDRVQEHQDSSTETFFSWQRIGQFGFSLTDQALSVGGMFLANIALARVRSKEEYGMFALSYSIYTFLSGLHNAAILEPFTVYGSGRYHRDFASYARLMWRSNATLGLVLTVVLLLIWRVLHWTAPALASSALLGMALTCGVLLSAQFVRRGFYIQSKPALAANFSALFFVVLVVSLLLFAKYGVLNSFTTFVVAGIAWGLATIFFWRRLPGRAAAGQFHEVQPFYWREHWKYARWVFATALVFQFMTQGYYWLLAGFLSVKEVAEFRAMHILVMPVDQVFAALTLVILPGMAFCFASNRMAMLISRWRKCTLIFLSVSIVFGLVVRSVSQPILHLTYGGKFDDMAPLLGMLALTPFLMAAGNAANAALKAIEKPNIVLYGYVASGAVTFLAGIPLVSHFGLRGAVYGMLISAGTYTSTLVASLVFLIGKQSVPSRSAW